MALRVSKPFRGVGSHRLVGISFAFKELTRLNEARDGAEDAVFFADRATFERASSAATAGGSASLPQGSTRGRFGGGVLMSRTLGGTVWRCGS